MPGTFFALIRRLNSVQTLNDLPAPCHEAIYRGTRKMVRPSCRMTRPDVSPVRGMFWPVDMLP